MNRGAIRLLKGVRSIADKCTGAFDNNASPLAIDSQGQAASDLIREQLHSPRPCMVTRLGGTELKTVLRYWNRIHHKPIQTLFRYVSGRQGEFWWDDQIRWEMQHSSGFFPCADSELSRFAEHFLRDTSQTDILGSWLPEESTLASYFTHASIVPLQDLEPYYHEDPWTTALEGRTVLVIHPFETSIRNQYEKRAALFADSRVLPEFTLKTLRAVQSLGAPSPGFETWFDALESMCQQIREIDFEVALIGAGAYGLPLAAFVKRIGRKAVHLGGATQILFGIKGKRWDERPFFQALYNEHWTRPLPEEVPANPAVGKKRHFDDGRGYW